MFRSRAIALPAVLALAALNPPTHAAIVGTTGSATQIGSPPSCLPFALTGPSAYAWDEQTNVAPSSGLLVDMSTNPSFAPGGNVPGLITGSVDSHFLHWEDYSGVSASGTVTFSGPIIGVMFSDAYLDLSDAPLGAFGTAYPTGSIGRGFGPQGLITINGAVLSFTFYPQPVPGNGTEQVRILTRHVPAPGVTALLGMAGLIGLRRRR
jgi:hypothetical protein